MGLMVTYLAVPPGLDGGLDLAVCPKTLAPLSPMLALFIPLFNTQVGQGCFGCSLLHRDRQYVKTPTQPVMKKVLNVNLGSFKHDTGGFVICRMTVLCLLASTLCRSPLVLYWRV